MEYKLLNKIIKKVKTEDITQGQEFNLILSNKYYDRLMKEIDSKYQLEMTYYKSGIDSGKGNTYYGVKTMILHSTGHILNLVISDKIETYKIIPLEPYDEDIEQIPNPII